MILALRRLLERSVRRVLPGKTERRLALVILVTSLAPLGVALWLATSMFRQASATWFNPEIGEQLDRGLDVYKDYVKAVKDDLKHQTVAIAADPVLREAAKKRNVETLEAEMDVVFTSFPELVSLVVEDDAGSVLARRDRGRPVDDKTERSLEVRRPLGDDEDAPVTVATFAVPRQRLDELESAGVVVARFHQMSASRSQLYEGYVDAFSALLGITMLVTVFLGILLARGVTRRIHRLGAALDLASRGDLSVRVPVTGSDELTELAATFNRMIAEMAQSRTRIEFLERVGAWQDMAQRLAHEIKNPLTPIQLAVQEVHRKFGTLEERRYKQLLDTTLEIVEEEVGTLRRLVGDFSNFARLPHADLAPASLSDFLRDCENQLTHLEEVEGGDPARAALLKGGSVDIAWELPKVDVRLALDRQMLRRVIVNLVENAVQSIRDHHLRASHPFGPPAGGVFGHVVVSAEAEGDGAVIRVEDDGPGVLESARRRVFDPYFTTKADGTGLGLAIVKKIVVEHGGEIAVTQSKRLGGACFTVHLPGMAILDVAASAREAREAARRQGVETA